MNWFRNPYVKVFLVASEDPADYKKSIRPRLRELIDKEASKAVAGQGDSESNPLMCHIPPWFIVHVVQSMSLGGSKKVFFLIRDEFNPRTGKKLDRCCQLCLSGKSLLGLLPKISFLGF